jgi:hypothetical protein
VRIDVPSCNFGGSPSKTPDTAASHGGSSSYLDMLTSPYVYIPHEVLAPGVLTKGDLADRPRHSLLASYDWMASSMA